MRFEHQYKNRASIEITQLVTHILCLFSNADGVERKRPKRKNQGSERGVRKEPRVSSTTIKNISCFAIIFAGSLESAY